MNSDYRPVVDFVIIGAQKCGTTSLASQLACHPQICLSHVKEPGHFNQDRDWRDGLEDYHALYTPEPGQICGEASTMYTFLPDHQDTHRRLYEYNPNLKLIYLMRQPVERVVSNYAHNVVRNLENRPPESAVFADFGYINRSRYAVQIRPYLELFGRENVLLLVFEEYVSDQQAALRTLMDFLGVQFIDLMEESRVVRHPSTGAYYLKSQKVERFVGSSLFQTIRNFVPASIRQPIRRRMSNRLDQKPEFSPSLRAEIWRWVEDDVYAIEQLLGRRLDCWRTVDTIADSLLPLATSVAIAQDASRVPEIPQ